MHFKTCFFNGQVLTSNGVGAAPTFQDAAGGEVGFPGTKVFDGNTSTSFTDLDLSSVVGVNSALVYLKIYNKSGFSISGVARKNGEALTVDRDKYGVTDFQCDNGKASYFMVVTDSSGVIEILVGTNPRSVEIYVEAYIA